MRILLDTHAFLWWVMNDSQLSDTAQSLITDPNNNVLFSTASAWEIVIKVNIGKLTLPESPTTYIPSRLASNQFEPMSIQMNHVLQVVNLPNYHRDPFDRILIAQSQVEQTTILTIDRLIIQYPVKTLW